MSKIKTNSVQKVVKAKKTISKATLKAMAKKRAKPSICYRAI